MNKMSNIKFAFFGTSDLSVKVLDILIKNGYTPDLVITVPDKPQGRKMIMTPPPVKVFAEAHNIKVDQPSSLSSYLLPPITYNLFIVASYGKIIPKFILENPKFGALNVHPSLLPKFRGPSPIQSFIMSEEKETGVTIMLMDDKIDHGPILSSQKLQVESRKLNAKKLEEKLAELGGEMLVEVIPKWINGEIKAGEQNHNQATFTKKIIKEDGLADLAKDSPEEIYRKFLAFQPWPGIYYFAQKNGKKIRVIITDMKLENNHLLIKKVRPEGKKEMKYDDFLKQF